MASANTEPPDLNPSLGATEDGETSIGNLGNSKHDTTLGENEATIQCSEATYQQFHQKITSLEQQLDTEKKLRIKAQNDFKNVSKQWKQVAQELNQQHTNAKSFHTVTDDYLKQLVRELRYDIRHFSQSYFEDLSSQPWPLPPKDGHSTSSVLPEQYKGCPASPILAQSFIWRVLAEIVFDQYQWLAEYRLGTHLYRISVHLRPKISSLDETESPSECEALKKFHTWRATTANMVFKSEDASRVSNAWETFGSTVIEDNIDPFISRFVRNAEYARYCDLLKQIIEKALVLDREISRQAAWVRWVFEDQNRRSDTAESDPSIDQERVRVIIAPALLKRGKSSGDKFEEQIELLSAESSVVQKLQSSRPPRTGWMK